MLLAEDSAVTTTGLWGVLGVVAAGLLALAGDWARRRWSSRAEAAPSEKIAADAASRELLTWMDHHVVAPMRKQLHDMGERLDAAQRHLDARDRDLAEARATIRELRQQLTFMERQLTERQGQIALLLRQLGDRHDEPPPATGPARPAARAAEPEPGGERPAG
jgi:septal ring factor EnvC (AmiA/AmiB activator)